MTQDQITQPLAEPEAYENYWGVEETFDFMLPDGKQYFTVRPMDEGGKTNFQKLTNKGIRMNQRTNDATIDVDPADERHTLIKESVVGWNLMQRSPNGEWSPFPCPADERMRKNNLRDTILVKMSPKVIQDLEYFIRTKNPWMQAEMTVEGIDEELDRLTTLRKQVAEREAGEDSSANK